MPQVPSQVLNNLGINLSAPTPQVPSYGMEEEYTRRREDECGNNNYGDSPFPNDRQQTLYGENPRQYQNNSFEDNSYEEDSYEESDYDNPNEFAPNPDRYDREYHRNIKMSDMGFSPDIIGDSDIIDYDNPYSNNSFEDREIVGGAIDAGFWSLENQFGNLKGIDKQGDPFGFRNTPIAVGNSEDFFGISHIGKPSQQDDFFGFSRGGKKFETASGDDLFGFGTGKKLATASADDLFGFSGINPNGTYGNFNFDPQTMYGKRWDAFKEKVNSFKQKVENKVEDVKDFFAEEPKEHKKEDYYEFKVDETPDTSNSNTEEAKSEEKATPSPDTPMPQNEEENKSETSENKTEETETKEEDAENKTTDSTDNKTDDKEKKEKKENWFKRAGKKLWNGIRQQASDGRKANSPDDVNDKLKSGSGVGSRVGRDSPKDTLVYKTPSAQDLFGLKQEKGEGEPYDYIGMNKVFQGEEKDILGMGAGEQDTFGFDKYSEREVATAENLFGYVGGGTPQTGEHLFGFVGVSDGRPQTSEELFGAGIGLNTGVKQSPLTFRETFGFANPMGEEAPIVQQHEIRTALVPTSNGAQYGGGNQRVTVVNPPSNVYGKKEDKKNKDEYPPIYYNQRVPDTNTMPQQQQEPQTQRGLYNRVGSILENNRDYASKFDGYAYNLDVGDMIGWKVDSQNDNVVGFNPAVIFGYGDFNAPSSTPKKRYRVTSITVPKNTKSVKKVTTNSSKPKSAKVSKPTTKKTTSTRKTTPKTSTKTSTKKKTTMTKSTKGKVKYNKNKENGGVDFNKLIWG